MSVFSGTLSAYRGELKSWSVTLTNPNGLAENLVTGSNLRFTVRSQAPASTITADADAIFSLTTGNGITVTTATSGMFKIQIGSAQTFTASVGDYYYGLEYTPSASANASVLAQGTFMLYADIVRGI